MHSVWKVSNLGLLLMVCSPIIALGFGWEAFFPVALTSVLGGVLCLLVHSMSKRLFVGQLTAELIQDLATAEEDRQDAVLAVLNKTERDWFLAELPRAKAELRRRQWQRRTDSQTSALWVRRLRILSELTN
jgi:hypothetical protein